MNGIFTFCTLLKWHPADLVYLVHLLGVNNSDLSIKRKWFFNTQFKHKFYLDSNTAITSMEILPPTWRADSYADVATWSCGLWLPASGSVSVVTSSPSCPLDQRTSPPFWCTICHGSNNREHERQDFKSSLQNLSLYIQQIPNLLICYASSQRRPNWPRWRNSLGIVHPAWVHSFALLAWQLLLSVIKIWPA